MLFLQTPLQIDHECRKKVDGHVEKLETIDIDEETGSEVVHWIMRFPVQLSEACVIAFISILCACTMWAGLQNRLACQPTVGRCGLQLMSPAVAAEISTMQEVIQLSLLRITMNMHENIALCYCAKP